MFRIVNIFFLICFTSLLGKEIRGQEYFMALGKLKTETGRLQNARIVVEKNGVRERVLTVEGSGKFEFKLDFNSNYIISFSQEGYVTKKVSFETTVPAERVQYGFAPFDFQVTIFKQFDDISTVIFNQPVGQIQFNPEFDDFDFDKDYSQSILKQMQQVEEESKEKAVQEEKQGKEKEKIREKEKKEKTQPEPPGSAPQTPPAITKKEEIIPPDPPKRTVLPVEEKKLQANTYTAANTNKTRNLVVLHAYTVGEYNYPNLPAYGYINFGNGGGNQEISKEQFQQYVQQYR